MRKSLKKAVGFIAIVAMLGSLTACTKKEVADRSSRSSKSTAETRETKEEKDTREKKEVKKAKASNAAFETALLSSKEIKAYDADYAMSMVMSDEEEKETMEMSGNMKVKGSTPEDMLFAADMQMSMLGIEIPVKYYYQDGYMYTEMEAQKYKMKLAYEEALQSVSSMPDLYEAGGIDLYDEITSEEVDGNTVYSYSVPAEKLSDLIEIMGSNNATASTGITEELAGEYKFSKFEGTITVDSDNNLVAQTMQMVMEYSEVSISMDMVLTMNKIGNEVEIVLPVFEGYEEIDAADLE